MKQSQLLSPPPGDQVSFPAREGGRGRKQRRRGWWVPGKSEFNFADGSRAAPAGPPVSTSGPLQDFPGGGGTWARDQPPPRVLSQYEWTADSSGRPMAVGPRAHRHSQCALEIVQGDVLLGLPCDPSHALTPL